MKRNMKKKLKDLYEQVPVPKEELSAMIDDTIAFQQKHQRRRPVRVISTGVAIFATACVSFVVMLNVSPAFAKTMYEIPVLGDICRVFTFREYYFEDNTKIVNVRIPNIENTGNTDLEKRINQEIRDKMDESVKDSEQRAQENYDAYIATGGDPKEYWPMDIHVDYEIKSSNERTLSFVIDKYEGHASVYRERYFYNLDLQTGKTLTLQDMFGADYQDFVYDQVTEQVEQLDPETKQYIFPQYLTKNLINQNRPFYLDENGNIVVVFEKYEIAAGAAGPLEFVINKESL